MGKIGDLWVRLGLKKDSYEKDLQQAKSSTKSFGDSAKGALGGVAAAFLAVVGAVKSLSDAIRTMAKFERANATLASVLKTTTANIKDLTNSAKELGRSTEFTASDVTQLQTELARLGFVKDDILDMQEAVLKFASAVDTDLASAAAFTGGSLRAFGLTANDTKDMLDIMADSTAKSALSFSKLQTSMGIVFPVAKTFNLSAKDTVAMLGALSNVLPDASSAATALRNILLNLADDNGKLATGIGHTAKTFPEIVNAFKELSERGVDLNEVLGMSDKKSVAAVAAFIQNTDALKDLRDAFDDSKGAVNEMYDTMTNNLIGSVRSLQSAWEGLTLAFSNSTGPIKDIVDWLTTLISKLTTLIEKAEAARNKRRAFEGLLEELIESGNPGTSSSDNGKSSNEGYKKREGVTDVVHTIDYNEIEAATVTADAPKPKKTKAPLTEEEKKAAKKAAEKKAEELKKTLEAIKDDYAAIAESDAAIEEMGNDIASKAAAQIGVTASGFSEAERQLAELIDISDAAAEAAGRGLGETTSEYLDRSLDEMLESMQNAAEQAKILGEEFRDAIISGFSAGVQELTDQIFGLSEVNPGAILQALLSPLADMAIREGELLIAQGLGIEAIKDSLTAMTGMPAIAAGFALLTIGAAAKSGLAALAKGGGSASTYASTSYGGDYGVNPAQIESEITVIVEGRISGSDIVLSGQNTLNSWNR